MTKFIDQRSLICIKSCNGICELHRESHIIYEPEYEGTVSINLHGNCYDCATTDSYFTNQKKGEIRRHIFKIGEETEVEMFDYIDVFYYRTMWHPHFIAPYHLLSANDNTKPSVNRNEAIQT